MLIFIDENNLTEKNIALLKYFEENIYNRAFPDDEREDFSETIRRINHYTSIDPQTFVILKEVDDIVVGGVVIDWFSKCEVAHIIYIVLDTKFRGFGYGKTMLWESLELFKKHINTTINNILIEVEREHNRKLMKDEMDSSKRIKFWKGCGAEEIKLDYVQPALSDDKKPIFNLMLMVLPLEKDGVISIDKDILKQFLKEFYISLNAEESIYLEQMIEEIDYDKN